VAGYDSERVAPGHVRDRPEAARPDVCR
jgi:hypothetical protein